MVPQIGREAPDFTAPSTSGIDVTLSSFRGKSNVLIAFFPLAFTSTCTAELCDFTTDFDEFTRSGTTVLPISVDSTATLKEYRAKYNMKADLLSDFKRQICLLYGVLNPEKFYSNRAYFLVDEAGTLRWSHVEEINKSKRTNAELIAEIERIS